MRKKRARRALISGDHFEFYPATDGWRWRAWARNGRKLGDGGQGYSRRFDAQRGAERLLGIRDGLVVIRDTRGGRAIGQRVELKPAERMLGLPRRARHPEPIQGHSLA